MATERRIADRARPLRRGLAVASRRALEAQRGERLVYQFRRLGPRLRRVRVRDPAERRGQAAAPPLRRADLRSSRPRRNDRVERRRRQADFRMAGGKPLLAAAQFLAPAFQRAGRRAGALRGADRRAADDQPVSQFRFYLPQSFHLHRSFFRRERLFQRAGNGDPRLSHLGVQFRARDSDVQASRPQPARPGRDRNPSSLGGQHDERAHRGISRGDLPARPPAWPRRSYFDSQRRGIFFLVGGRKAQNSHRLASGKLVRAAGQLVPSAFQSQPRPCALSGAEALGLHL